MGKERGIADMGGSQCSRDGAGRPNVPSYELSTIRYSIERNGALRIRADRRNGGNIVAAFRLKSHNAKRWLAGTDETENYKLPIAVERSPQLPKRRKRDRDREERACQAGGPKPSLRAKAYALARERATVKTCDFTAIGIPRHYLAWMCEEGLLVKVGYGVYRAAECEAA